MSTDRPFELGEWTVQPALDRLERGDESQRLEPKVMRVLLELASRPGEVFSKQALLDTVWADTFVADGVLLRSISELRRALGDDAKAPRYIETIPKRGYRLLAAVEPVRVEAAARAETAPAGTNGVGTAGGRSLRTAVAAAAALAIGVAAGTVVLRRAPAEVEHPAERPVASPIDETLARAWSFYQRRDPAGNANAIELFKQALEQDPESAAAYAGLARAYADSVTRYGLDESWLPAAVDAGRRAATLAPELAAAHHALARALLAAERWREARGAAERALELAPDLSDAWLDLARVHALSGRLDESVRCLRRAGEIGPTSARLEAELAHVLRLLGEPDAAARAARRSLTLEPFEPQARSTQVRLAIDAGAWVTARDLLRALREVSPADPRTLDLAGLVETAVGDREAAEGFFRRADEAAQRPDWGRLHLAALAVANQRQDGQAVEELLAAVEDRARQRLAEGSEHWLEHLLLAGTAAVGDDPDGAVVALRAADAAGFRDLRMLEADPAFAGLAGDPDFRSWRADLEQRIDEMRRRLGTL